MSHTNPRKSSKRRHSIATNTSSNGSSPPNSEISATSTNTTSFGSQTDESSMITCHRQVSPSSTPPLHLLFSDDSSVELVRKEEVHPSIRKFLSDQSPIFTLAADDKSQCWIVWGDPWSQDVEDRFRPTARSGNLPGYPGKVSAVQVQLPLHDVVKLVGGTEKRLGYRVGRYYDCKMQLEDEVVEQDSIRKAYIHLPLWANLDRSDATRKLMEWKISRPDARAIYNRYNRTTPLVWTLGRPQLENLLLRLPDLPESDVEILRQHLQHAYIQPLTFRFKETKYKIQLGSHSLLDADADAQQVIVRGKGNATEKQERVIFLGDIHECVRNETLPTRLGVFASQDHKARYYAVSEDAVACDDETEQEEDDENVSRSLKVALDQVGPHSGFFSVGNILDEGTLDITALSRHHRLDTIPRRT